MSQLGSKKVCKLEDIMELGYAVKKSRLWENEAFSKNKNYDSGFLPLRVPGQQGDQIHQS